MGRKKSQSPSPLQGSNSKNSKKLAYPLSAKKKKVKKLRKSSLSKAQKNFAVFNKMDEHINKYENLPVDISDEEHNDSHSDKDGNPSFTHDGMILIDEYDDQDIPNDSIIKDVKEVDVIDLDSEEENVILNNNNNNNNQQNALDNNEDFIPFAVSSGEEDEKKDEHGTYDYDDYDDEYPSKEEEEQNAANVAAKRTLNTDYPWVLSHDHSKQKEIADWLTLEIKDFVSYISPSREEIETRNFTISKVRDAVQQLWSDADLHVFGSFATDLYLPGSDIDCVVNSRSGDKENRNALYSLASFLKRRKLATQVEVISRARVPIIKFVEPESGIHIDVSFERTNGLEAARIIRNWLDETPGLRELVLIVKQFLSARRLNNVHTGGLGGFSIICLVYSFLQLHPRILTNDINSLENLGVLLIDFFELYGKNFGYDDVAISVQDGQVGYLPKDECPALQNPRSTFSLAIQDPGDSSNNISRGSFNLRDIKKAFAGAFDLLTNRCFDLDAATFKDRLGKSILGNVIKYRGKQRDFKDERSLVINKAIVENEQYHKKRGRIVKGEIFTDVSDNENEEDLYKVEGPARKKKKKKTQKVKKDNAKVVNQLMGINDEEDDYNPVQTNTNEEEGDDYNPEDDKKNYVDKRTKRDYWLSKGQTL